MSMQPTIPLPIYNAEAIQKALDSLVEYLAVDLATLDRSRSLARDEKAAKFNELQQDIVRLQGLQFALGRSLDLTRAANIIEAVDPIKEID